MRVCGTTGVGGLLALLLVGCGSGSPAQVIGTRPDSSQDAATVRDHAGLAESISQRLDAQLAQAAASSQNTTGVAPLALDYPAYLTLNQGERLLALRRLGDAAAAKGLGQVGTLAASVQQNTHLTPQQRATLLAQCNEAAASLTALRQRIAAGTLVDVVRADVESITGDHHVSGLLDPKIHLLAAASEMLNVNAVHQSDLDQLSLQYERDVLAGLPVGSAGALLADLRTRVARVRATADDALATLPTLTPQAFPTNKPVLDRVHDAVAAARADIPAAAGDISSIRAQLT